MFSRKRFLWNSNDSLPRRTRYRKKRGDESNCSNFEVPTDTNILTEPSENFDESIYANQSSNEPVDCLDESLYENSKISLKSSLTLIMAFCLKFHITNDGLEHLLSLINLHMPNSPNFPKTKYHFFQNFKAFSKQVKLYVPCSNCNVMLSDFVDFEFNKNIVCENCRKNDVYGRFNVGSKYFFIFDIKTQILNILNNKFVQKNIWRNDSEPDNYSDITSGHFYKLLDKCKHDITLSFNTDGVPLFKSSSLAIWPIQLIINELPYSVRRKHIILGGLWVGPQSPGDEYFEQFIENFNLHFSQSFAWNWKGTDIKSNVYIVLCTCDSVARCKLQNIVQFNGYYGCTWCEKKGISVEKGRGRMMSYAEDKSSSKLSDLRNPENVYNSAKLAVEKNTPILGIKGPSVLTPLKNFNVVKSFVIDYMHCVCLGIVRSLTMLWLDSTQQDPFYINESKKKFLNEKLSTVQTPSIIRRKPRKLNCIKYWKATEYLYWLLFYSPVFLIHILPPKYYNHWLLLVCSMHHLLGNCITNEELNLIEYLLAKFVIDTNKLYGPEYVTYNIHMLLHVPECVRNWGMPWNYSNFMFESFNGTLKKFVYGSQKAGYQIAQRFLTYKFIRNTYYRDFVGDNATDNLLSSLVQNFKFKIDSKDINLGNCKLYTNNDLITLFKGRKYSKMYEFKNVIYKGTRFTPKGQERVSNKKSANFIVFKDDNLCAVLCHLVSFKKEPLVNDIYCIVNSIQCSQYPFFKIRDPKFLFKNIMSVDGINHNFDVWHLRDIKKIGIFFKGNKEFVACIPGCLEKD